MSRMVLLPRADYERLLVAAESDDTIGKCEQCGAWIDMVDDPAWARVEDFSGCWFAATGRERDRHLCRKSRNVDLLEGAAESLIRAAPTQPPAPTAPEPAPSS